MKIDEYVNKRQALTIVADLSNANKHSENQTRSRLNPHVEMVRFDTSKSGVLEIYIDGAKKEKELIVSSRSPIPYVVELNVQGETIPRNAGKTIYDALRDWLPLISQLGVLDGDNAEAKHLRAQLGI